MWMIDLLPWATLCTSSLCSRIFYVCVFFVFFDELFLILRESNHWGVISNLKFAKSWIYVGKTAADLTFTFKLDLLNSQFPKKAIIKYKSVFFQLLLWNFTVKKTKEEVEFLSMTHYKQNVYISVVWFERFFFPFVSKIVVFGVQKLQHENVTSFKVKN